MAGALIEWDVSTWDEIVRAIDSFNGGADVFLRLHGPMNTEELFHIYQVLDYLASDGKVASVPGDDRVDLALFHPVDTGPGGDPASDREPRRPRPGGDTDSMSRDLPER